MEPPTISPTFGIKTSTCDKGDFFMDIYIYIYDRVLQYTGKSEFRVEHVQSAASGSGGTI